MNYPILEVAIGNLNDGTAQGITFPANHQIARLEDSRRLQQDRVHGAEDGAVRSDRQGQCDDSRSRVSGLPEKVAEGEADVSEQFHGITHFDAGGLHYTLVSARQTQSGVTRSWLAFIRRARARLRLFGLLVTQCVQRIRYRGSPGGQVTHQQ